MHHAELPPFLPGNTCTILRDGDETFPAMLQAIARAERFVHLEVFRLSDDPLGRMFVDALAERARAGVEVRVLLDGVGSLLTPWSTFAPLLLAGGRIAIFRPPAPWRRRWGLYRRDHRKILVVDGGVGFTGGLNVDRCHAAVKMGGFGWRDTHLRIEGPAVVELERAFWETWFESAPPEACPLDLGPYSTPTAPTGPHAVQVVANGVREPQRSPIRRAYLAALARARQRAWITNPYFLPDAAIVRALVEAAGRGVDVRLLVPERSDIGVVDLASRPILRALAARGIRVFQYVGRILHAKTAVVDDRWSTVGSLNLDSVSFRNLELNVMIDDAEMGATMARMFQDDLRSARELTPLKASLPVHLRAAEWAFFGLRHWM